MKIVITSIELRSYWSFFKLANYARLVLRDLRREPACIAIKTKGLGKLHYTMTIWDNPEDMKKWYIQGNHLQAMKIANKIATAISTYTYDGEAFPQWNDAVTMLNESGKTITYN